MSNPDTLTQAQKLAAVWRNTHRDFKGTTDGKKSILVCRGGTCLVPLEDLTQQEIKDRL